MKKMSIYSLAALVALVSIGCGGGGNSNIPTQGIVQNNNQAATVSGLNNLKSTSKLDTLSDNSGVKSSFDTASESDTEIDDTTSLCDTGSIVYNANEATKVITVNADNCSDGSSTLDGAVSVKLEGSDENPTGATATVTRDISLNDNTQNSFSIEKDATLNVDFTEVGNKEYTDLETTFKSKVNGVTINVLGLKVKITEEDMGGMQDDKSEIDVKSGEFNIGSYYFKIDESKNNTISDNAGTIHMTDGADNGVVLMVEDGELVLKVDENGDGIYSDNEIVR